MCPLWNRSSSLASSGGITNRTGSNTEENYSQQSTPAAATNSSGGKGFLGWVGDNSKGIGKIAGVAVPLIGAGIGALVGGPGGAVAGFKIANTAKNVIGAIGDNVDRNSGFGKFARGLNNKRLNEATGKTFDMFKENKKNKLNEFGNIISDYRAENNKAKPLSFNNTVSSVSNGHVPIGYQASTSQGSSAPNEMKSVVSTGSTSVLVNKRKNRKKNKRNKKNKNKK